MARPPTLEATETIQIRVSPALKEQFQTAATAARRSLSDWMRVTCEDAITRPPSRARRKAPA